MKTPEIFTRFTATSRKGQADSVSWEDVGLAAQGLKPEYKAFIEYVFIQDPAGRHNFFAGLFMDVMERRDVQDWVRDERARTGQYGSINKMVVMTIEEWRVGANQVHTDKSRSQLFGVSRGTWAAKYKIIYNVILETPLIWEQEIMQIMNKRLR